MTGFSDSETEPAEPAESGERVGVRRLRGVAELTSLEEVRAAAKDWGRFSSRLQGDPDVRDYPQLPLEVDPPEHGAYRALLDPILGRRAVAALEPEVRAIARELVASLVRRGRAEAVHELAVPMVATAIAHAFGRPGDAAELTSWGSRAGRTNRTGRGAAPASTPTSTAYSPRVPAGAAKMRSHDSPTPQSTRAR